MFEWLFISRSFLALSMLSKYVFLIEVESVSLYYCNSSFLTPIGMADGMYLFDSVQAYTFIGARDACKAWPFPTGARNVNFLSNDIMTTSPNAIKPSLASLWNPINFNIWKNFLLTSGNDYWVGLGQDINVTTCPNAAITGVYERSWNWTWLDGTPMLRDTKGQGLVWFKLDEPSNNGASEHYGSSYFDDLNDAVCGNGLRATCSIPRKPFKCWSHNFLDRALR
jgi:hypothetical protein